MSSDLAITMHPWLVYSLINAVIFCLNSDFFLFFSHSMLQFVYSIQLLIID